MYHGILVEGRGQLLELSSAVWAPGVERRPSGVVASAKPSHQYIYIYNGTK